MSSILDGILIPSVCVFPSLIYAYQHYKKNKSDKLEFVLTNVVAVLIVFTIYMAEATLT